MYRGLAAKSSAVKISCTMARTGKGQPGRAAAHALALDIRMRDGGQHDVVMPSGIRPPFEVIEAELGLEFLVLLFDRPALMGQADECGNEVAAAGGRSSI